MNPMRRVVTIWAAALALVACGAVPAAAPGAGSAAAGSARTSPSLQPSADAPSNGSASTGQTVLVGFPGGHTLDYVPYAIADAQAFYAKQGLSFKEVQLKSDAAVAGLSAGQIQYGVNLSTLLRAAVSGAPIRLLMAVSNPNYAFLTQPELRSASELKGKTIGITVMNGNFYYAAEAVLEHEGVPTTSVKLVSFANAEGIFAALQQKLIDAGIVDSTVALAAEKAGFHKLMSTASVYRGALDGLATSQTNITQHPDEVRKMILAILLGMQYVRQHQAETTAFIAKYVNQDTNTAASLYQDLIAGLSANGEVTPDWVDSVLPSTKGQQTQAFSGIQGLVDLGPLHDAQKTLGSEVP